MRDTKRGSIPPNHAGSVAALPRKAGKLERFSKLLKSWLMPMLECAVSSSAPPHECVPNSILSPEFSEGNRFLDSPLENNDILPELSGKSESIRNADEVLSELSDIPRKGDSPTISCFVERKGDEAITLPPMGAPAIDVILSNTASAMDEGRSPCPLALAALPVEIVRSARPNLALWGGGDWGKN
mmetsp:Transcript_13451/g.21916  ORF Transcript_13451/g.21916 Transcript_13451/m.21916 type:complete len:185 (-) Transcript_13451:179-733(-)